MSNTIAVRVARSFRTTAGVLIAGTLMALSTAHAALGDEQRRPLDSSPPAGTVTPNPDAGDLLLRAAEAGNAEAMNILGVLFVVGTRVPRDYPTALYWFQKAIDAGSSTAMNNVATMFGTSRDPSRARTMFRKAAESGYAPAMVRISDDYARGSGVRPDLVEAYAWLQVALERNESEDLQISVLSKMAHLETRLAPQRRDAARVRAAELSSAMKARPTDRNDSAAKLIQT